MKNFLAHAESIPKPQKCITDVTVQKFETYKEWSYDKDYMWNNKLNLRFIRCSSNKCINCEPIEVPEILFDEEILPKL